MEYDVIIIGGGPGGYVAAIRAKQLKMRVALVEAADLGGVCLNWGCIPTKALLRSADVYHLLQHAENFGLKASGISFDLKKIVERSRGVAKQLASGINHLMKKHQIEVVKGFASLQNSNTISVQQDGDQNRTMQAKKIILATGARPRVLNSLPIDGTYILSAKEAMVLEEVPESLAIVGSGPIGMEFASFYQAFGSKVTIIEANDRILRAEDAEIASLAQKSFQKRGMEIMLSCQVQASKIVANKVELTLSTGQKLVVNKVISAIGVVANTEKLGLDKTKVHLQNGHVATDKYCVTTDPNIYAIGDVAAAPWLAHKASHEGIIAVEHIAGMHPHAMEVQNIPGCTYCHPQIASVGINEEQAKASGLSYSVGKFPFSANGKAIAMGDTEGLIKIISDKKTGEILGAHMIGAEVTEMIQGFVIGKTLEATIDEIIHSVFPHPTLSEMMHEAALASDSRAIHI